MTRVIHTKEFCDRIIVLAGEGLSASQIARKVGNEFFILVTRNTVCSILFRMRKSGATGTRLHSQPRKKAEAGDRPKPKQRLKVVGGPIITAADPNTPLSGCKHLSLFDLRYDSCRYIHGDTSPGGTYTFCGLEKVKDLPYCPEHVALCYVPGSKGNLSTKAVRDKYDIAAGAGS